MKNEIYFMKITKEEIINIIDKRIKSEYSKHKELDWSNIAAHKIYDTMINIFNVCDFDDLMICPCCQGTGICTDINNNEGSCMTCCGSGKTI